MTRMQGATGRVRRWRRAFCAVAAACVALAGLSAMAATKREAAASRYRSAAQLYQDLRQVPPLELGRRQYELVISKYRQVLQTDPTSGYCDDALLRIAELYGELAERSEREDDRAQELSAYRFLAREYPHSKHRGKAISMARRLAGPEGREAPAPEAQRPRAPVRPAGAERALALSDSHPPDRIVQPPGGAKSEGGPAGISGIRHHGYEDGTRVVVDMDSETPLKYEWLKRPDRLYIDLFGGRLEKSLAKGREIRIEDALLKSARLAQNRTSKARLVLDLEQAVSFDAFWLASPVRLVLDVRPRAAPRLARTLEAFRAEGSEPALAELPVPPAAARETDPAPRAAAATITGSLSLTRALGLKFDTVFVDAGHGGHDTGSVGPGGLREKDVVLDISKRLGGLLQSRLGVRVLYSRESDVFVPLEDRSKLANEAQADLMISIHCNSAPSSRVRGIETYFLNLTEDPWALSVAAHENAAASLAVHELRDLVSRITRNDTLDESRELATKVQSKLHAGVSKHSSSIRNRGVRQAPFVVLVNAEMPAILAEIAFLSNKSDEALLRKPAFRQEVAEHLFRGIAAYASSLGMTSSAGSPSAGSALRD